MLAAKVLPMEARVYSSSPASKMGLRPQRSDSGPQKSWEQPNASSRALKVSCPCVTLAPRA